MDPLLVGTLALVAGLVLALILPGNKLQVGVNLVTQAIACCCILYEAVPVVLGAEHVTQVLHWSYPVGDIELELKPIGAFFLLFAIPMTFLGSIYAVGYLKDDINDSSRHVGTHFALLSLVQLSYVIVYTVENAFAFLVGWEFAAIGAWLLVIWYHRNQKIRFAGFNYLVSTHLGLIFLVAAVMLMHGATGSFKFSDYEVFLSKPGVTRNITFVLLMTSFGLKSAFFPFHTWLPRAHSAAPAHVSALMSGVIHKAGLFGMITFIFMVGRPEPWMGWYLMLVSGMSAFMGVLYTISQRDIKRLLGYSSTENVGLVGVGFGLGCLGLAYDSPVLVALGFGSGLLHVLNHALFKCLLFYCAGAIYRFTHTIDLEKLGGLSRRMPWTSTLFLFGGIAMAAMPPLNGFVSEFLLYSGLIETSVDLGNGRLALLAMVAVLALVGGISALSITRAYGLIFLGVPRDPNHVGEGARENAWMTVPMVLHLVGMLAIGMVPVLGIKLIAAPTAVMLRHTSTPDAQLFDFVSMDLLNSLTMFAAGFVGVLALLMALRFFLLPRANRKHVTWGCGYTAPNSRMQYTGASFSAPLVTVFQDLLIFVTQEKLPEGVFPEDGKYQTHNIDAVENRVFEVLKEGESGVGWLMNRLPETSSFSFAVGLVSLVILISLVVLT